MEVKKIVDVAGCDNQRVEFLYMINQLVDNVAYWKEYAQDLQHQVEDLGHDLDDCDAARKESRDAELKAKKENLMLTNRIESTRRTMLSIQDELQDSLAPETYEVIASLFDLDLPFEEV